MKLTKEMCLNALETMDYPSEEWDIIEQLINQHFDENGNVKAFANICFDEEKMREICHEAVVGILKPIINDYENKLDFIYDILKEISDRNGKIIVTSKKEWREWLQKAVEE